MNILYDKLNQSDWNVFTRILILNLYYVWMEQKEEFLFLVLASILRLFGSIEKFGILLPNSKLIIKYFFQLTSILFEIKWVTMGPIKISNRFPRPISRFYGKWTDHNSKNTHEANFRPLGDVSSPPKRDRQNHEEGGRTDGSEEASLL